MYLKEAETANQDIYDDFKFQKQQLWSLWFKQKYFSVVRVEENIIIVVFSHVPAICIEGVGGQTQYQIIC